MNTTAKIFYLSGQRKRKRVGIVREVRDVAGVKAFKIQKLWLESWIPEKDVINGMDTKTEETKGSVGDDGGRNKTESQDTAFTTTDGTETFVSNSEKDPSWYIPEASEEGRKYLANLQSESQAGTRIPENPPSVASGETLRVPGDESGGEPDMFPEVASSVRRSPSAWTRGKADLRDESFPARLPDSPHLDRSEPSDSLPDGIPPARLERNRQDKAYIDKIKKRIYRGIRNGRRNLAEFSDFIGQMATRNDARFFAKLAVTISQRRKTKKPTI